VGNSSATIGDFVNGFLSSWGLYTSRQPDREARRNNVKGACSVKYLSTWWPRPAGTAADYKQMQQRILELFQKWQVPETIVFHQFLVRVGEFGGYAVIETDDLPAVHQMATVFAGFHVRLEPVLDIMDAVSAELQALAWRDSVV